jgi:alkylation response protein AidB-like acyl-CoA dehydrogenase
VTPVTSDPRPVVLDHHPGSRDLLRRVASEAAALAGHEVEEVLAWAVSLGAELPRPGGGRTLRLWGALAVTGATDLTVARVLEPHLDALGILHEAGQVAPAAPASYGVWAAEGRGTRLQARRAPDGTWRLSGDKPWCSLAGSVDRALVTAWVDDDHRGLFDLPLGPGVTVHDGSWSAHALAGVVTSTTTVHDVAAEPVGGPGWYLSRDGFAWGGIGVAAVWYGGAVGLARRLREATTQREPDQLTLMHLGAVDGVLAAARASLVQAADAVDAGRAGGAAGALLAARVRRAVAHAAEVVASHVGHALGPGPLAHEPEHAQRVADLALYVRQHHAERDDAALGRTVAALPATEMDW